MYIYKYKRKYLDLDNFNKFFAAHRFSSISCNIDIHIKYRYIDSSFYIRNRVIATGTVKSLQN